VTTDAKTKKTGAPTAPAVPPPGAEKLIDRAAIIEALGISERNHIGMVAAGEYPAPDLKIGRLVRWRTATHNEWIDAASKKRGV
jgi:predicted DNA-binding transcriptional regulator AlpA